MRNETTRNLIAETLPSSISGQTAAATFAKHVRQVTLKLKAAVRVAIERRALSRLDERMLKDIGMSRSLAHHEATRSFFDIPGSRIDYRG